MTSRSTTVAAPSSGLERDAVFSPGSERELGQWLEEMICDGVHGTEASGLRIACFARAGLLTADEGLVLRFPGGAEFQLTIVRSR